MSVSTPSVPELPLPFSVMFRNHMARGTRPPQSGIAIVEGPWTFETLSIASRLTPRTLRRYAEGAGLPRRIEPLLRAFFGMPMAPGGEKFLESWADEINARERIQRLSLPKFSFPAGGVNVMNRDSIDAELSAMPATPLPAQGAGPHFSMSVLGRIRNAAPTEINQQGNNGKLIADLLPLSRESVQELIGKLNQKHNSFVDLARVATLYRDAIALPVAEISWGYVWGLGLKLDTRAAAAERQIADRLEPEMEDSTLAALQEVRTLHAPLILATGEGRKLQNEAEDFISSAEEKKKLRDASLAMAEGMTEDVAEREAKATVIEAASSIGEGRRPEHSTMFGMVTVKHVCIVVVAAAMAAVPSIILGPLGTPLTMGAWEALKNSPRIAQAFKAVGGDIERVWQGGGVAAQQAVNRLAPFKEFVRKNDPHLRQISGSSGQLRWLTAYLDYLKQLDATKRGE